MNRTILMVQLWDKVKTLLSEKLTVAQVSRILGIDRKTVRKYRDMSQEQISALVDNEVKRRLCKLEAYRDFTVNLLKEKPMLSSPQVHALTRIQCKQHHIREEFMVFPQCTCSCQLSKPAERHI